MSSKTRTLAIALSAVLVLSVLGTGAAMAAENETVDDSEGDELDAESTNETDDGNETVDDGNETDDNETDADGNETVDENGTDDSNATDDRPFGQVVTAFVHGLIDGSNDTNDTNTTNDSAVPLGQQIAAFVVANNPGNAPDHAGPGGQPPHAGAGNETGKPAHAGGANETGQPDHAGQPGDEKRGGPDKDNGGGGPPAHAGRDA